MNTCLSISKTTTAQRAIALDKSYYQIHWKTSRTTKKKLLKKMTIYIFFKKKKKFWPITPTFALRVPRACSSRWSYRPPNRASRRPAEQTQIRPKNTVFTWLLLKEKDHTSQKLGEKLAKKKNQIQKKKPLFPGKHGLVPLGLPGTVLWPVGAGFPLGGGTKAVWPMDGHFGYPRHLPNLFGKRKFEWNGL